MPLGKYYCDYCDKQFQDTAAARRRHLSGIQHQRAKAQWYDSIRVADANQIPPEFLGKGVCNRFVRTGSCPYGDACIYYHPIQNLQRTNLPGMTGTIQAPNVPGTQLVGGASVTGDTMRDAMGFSLGNLPPSLRPPPDGGYPPLPFVDWG